MSLGPCNAALEAPGPAGNPSVVARKTQQAMRGITAPRVPATHSGSPPWVPTYVVVLEHRRRVQSLQGVSAASIAAGASVCHAFLARQGIDPETNVDPLFIDRLANALVDGTLEGDFELSATGGDDSGYRSRLRSMVESYRALCCPSFAGALRDRLTSLGARRPSYREIAVACGATRLEVVAWASTGGMTVIKPVQALAMDSCLAAKGWILDRYVALTQRPIEEHPGTIADQILGRDGFATLLRSGRERLGRTLAEVAAALSQRNLMVRPDQLGHWELGNSVASLQHENVIRALDQLYDSNLLSS